MNVALMATLTSFSEHLITPRFALIKGITELGYLPISIT